MGDGVFFSFFWTTVLFLGSFFTDLAWEWVWIQFNHGGNFKNMPWEFSFLGNAITYFFFFLDLSFFGAFGNKY